MAHRQQLDLHVARAATGELHVALVGHGFTRERAIHVRLDHVAEGLFAHVRRQAAANDLVTRAAPVSEEGVVDVPVDVLRIDVHLQVQPRDGHGGELCVLQVHRLRGARRFLQPGLFVFEQAGHQARELAQGVELHRVQLPGLPVEHTDRAQHEAVVGDDGCTGVEAHLGRPGHERVVLKACVLAHVLDHGDVFRVEDGVRAEGHFARCFTGVHADARLEPLPVAVDQRDQGHGGAADHLSQGRDVVKGLLGQGVEDAQSVQTGQALFLVDGMDGDRHAGGSGAEFHHCIQACT